MHLLLAVGFAGLALAGPLHANSMVIHLKNDSKAAWRLQVLPSQGVKVFLDEDGQAVNVQPRDVSRDYALQPGGQSYTLQFVAKGDSLKDQYLTLQPAGFYAPRLRVRLQQPGGRMDHDEQVVIRRYVDWTKMQTVPAINPSLDEALKVEGNVVTIQADTYPDGYNTIAPARARRAQDAAAVAQEAAAAAQEAQAWHIKASKPDRKQYQALGLDSAKSYRFIEVQQAATGKAKAAAGDAGKQQAVLDAYDAFIHYYDSLLKDQ